MEENNRRVQEGFVKELDNDYGKIINKSGIEYEFVKRDVETKDIQKNDEVRFFAEKYMLNDKDINIARYVRKK